MPSKGLTQAIPDLVNETNQFQLMMPLPVLELVAAGKLRALAVTGPTRLPALKDVLTVVDAGFPDLIIQDWFGILVKSGVQTRQCFASMELSLMHLRNHACGQRLKNWRPSRPVALQTHRPAQLLISPSHQRFRGATCAQTNSRAPSIVLNQFDDLWSRSAFRRAQDRRSSCRILVCHLVVHAKLHLSCGVQPR